MLIEQQEIAPKEEELLIADLLKDQWLRQNAVEKFGQILRQSQEIGWRSVSSVISKVLRDPQLHSRQRRLLSDLLYELIRKMRRLKAISGIKAPTAEQYYGLWLLDLSLKNLKRENAKNFSFPQGEMEGLGFKLPQLLERYHNLERSYEQVSDREQATEVLADAQSYPSWQVQALIKRYGLLEAKKILENQNLRAPLTIRVNLLRTSRDAMSEILTAAGIPNQKTTLSPWGLILETRTNVYGLSWFQEGLFELQDEGSQLLAELVAPPPGSIVIDACAGAGGKTLALGALMQNKGRLYAIDIDQKKLLELRKRARRAGLSNVQTLQLPEDQPLLTTTAHRVLCDVPCSGLGVVRRNPETRWAVQKSDIQEFTQKQKAILEQAAHWVREGGRLIYSTCSLLPEENESIIEDFLKNHPEFVLMTVKEIWGTERAKEVGDGSYLRLLPTQPLGPDGFFAAVLRKK